MTACCAGRQATCAAVGLVGCFQPLPRGLAKQAANRILEPFQWMHTVVTATEWDNFFALRCHPDAQPEMQVLAFAMRGAMDASTPWPTEHHFPYLREEDGVMSMWRRAMVSAARCARVSYLKHDGTAPSIGEDLALFERLAGGTPIHASPLEHQGFAMEHPRRRSRNFVGWWQFRELFEGAWLERADTQPGFSREGA